MAQWIVLLLRMWLFLFVWTGSVDSFCSVQPSPCTRFAGVIAKIAASTSSNNYNEGPVNKDAFVTAYQLIQQSVGEQGAEAGAAASTFDDYVIGRVQVELNLVPEPGLELAEAPNGLTLVRAVSGNAKDVGVLVGDTIIQVAGGYMKVNTRELSLDVTGSFLMQAAENAAQCGTSIVQLTLNRLIKIKFADSS